MLYRNIKNLLYCFDRTELYLIINIVYLKFSPEEVEMVWC
jgi:hypothetical protein